MRYCDRIRRPARQNRNFVLMQLVQAMATAETGADTLDIADAMFHVGLIWDGILREEERHLCEGNSSRVMQEEANNDAR